MKRGKFDVIFACVRMAVKNQKRIVKAVLHTSAVRKWLRYAYVTKIFPGI